MSANTPSQSKKQALNTIAGSVITCNQNIALIEEHQKKLDNKIVENDIINSVVATVDSSKLFMKSSANMLMAIAGYLFGEKNINLNTDSSSLLNKISNTTPVLGEGPTVDPDQLIASDNGGYIEIIVSGLDKDGLNGLVAVMDQMYQGFGSDNAKAIEVFAVALDTLEQVAAKILAMNLDNFDKKFINHTISFKEVLNLLGKEIESENSIGKIKGFDIAISNLSQLATKLKTSDIKSFNKRYIASVSTFKEVLEKVNEIMASVDTIKDSANLAGIQSFVAVSQALNVNLSDLDPSVLQNYDVALDSFMSIVDKLSILDFSQFNTEFIENAAMLSAVTDILNSLNFVQSSSIEDMKSYAEFSDMIYYIVDNFSKLNLKNFDEAYMQSASDFNVFLEIVSDITKVITKQLPLLFLIDLFKDQLLEFPETLAHLISGKNGSGGLVMVMNRIDKAEQKGLSIVVITEFFKDFEGLIKVLNKVGTASIFASITSKFIDKAIGTVMLIIDKIADLDIKEITANIDNITKAAQFMKSMQTIFVAASVCALFALPAIVGLGIILLTSKLLFKTLNVVIEGFNGLPDAKDFQKSIKSVGIGILLLSGVMTIATLAGAFVTKHMSEILGFGFVLGLFILSVVGPIMLLSKLGGDKAILGQLGSLTNLIITCSVIMLLGAWFYQSKLWSDSLLFGAVLGLFIGVVLLPLIFVSRFSKGAIEGAKDISMLVVGCALVLMLGALFMKSGLWKEAINFGLMVIGFVTLIMLPFALISIFGKTALTGVKEIARLVITLSLILVFGALFMLTGLWKESLEFAGMVTLFMWAIVLPFLIGGKQIENAFKPLLGLTILVAVASAILIIAGLTMEDVSFGTLLGFTVCVGLLVGEMAFIAYQASQKQKDIMKGIPALALLSLVAMLAAIPIKMFGETIAIIGGEDAGAKMLGMVLCASALLLAMGALSYAAGALVMGPQALLFMAGIGALSLLATVALLTGVAMKNIGEALLILQAVDKGGGIDINKISTLVSSFIDIAKVLSGIEDEIDPIALSRVSYSMMAVAMMTSKLGIAVQDISNLKCATAWDSNGNPTAYRQLNNQDFENAAKNTKLIVSTLGGAIIELYNGVGLPEGISKSDVQEMFAQPSAGGIAGFFGKKGTSKFDLVVRSCTGLGNMISMIGRGVQDVANLKVATAWDSNGNPRAFRQLDSKDFKAAASNTKEIITTLGRAIIELYNGVGLPDGITKNDVKEMFEPMETTTSFLGITIKKKSSGPNKFEKVVQSCTTLGNMISSIAKGVGDMANLTVADKWDKDGNPISFRHLGDDDFKKAASNTKLIITTLGGAIIDLYNGNLGDVKLGEGVTKEDIKSMFTAQYTWEDGKLTGNGETPIVNVLTAANLMGSAISSIATGVKDMADLRIQNYDANGKPLGTYRSLGEEDFKDASNNAAQVVSCLAVALDSVYKTHSKMFDEVVTYTTHSSGVLGLSKTTSKHVSEAPIVKVLTAAGSIGTFMASCAQAVKEVADLHFINEKGERVKIKREDMEENGKVRKAMKAVVTCLGTSLISIYDSGKNTYFNADWEPYKRIPNTLEVCQNVVMQSIDSVESLNKLFNDVKIDSVNTNWNKTITGLLKPFEGDKISSEGIDLLNKASGINANNLEYLVRNINSLEVSKVDKFIELSQELRGLSLSFDDLGGLVDALNGRINETLTDLAEKLEYAAKTIELSDKAQKERQKFIEKNTRAIKDAMNKPMTIKVERDVNMTSGSTGSNIGSTDSNLTGGSAGGSGGGISNATASQIASNTKAIKDSIAKFLSGVK